ncbi:MAG TPA: HAD family hydrolase [Acidiferrobacterales bacterium]|nr:HAD family hydrolase [Acidiferrobacterales bacterium]
MSLAIFDLDNTLLSGDSDYAWGQFLIERNAVEQEGYERENQRYYEKYRVGTLDIFAFLAFALRPLKQYERAQLDAWHRQFMQSKILPMITPAARALVEKHRRAGDTLLIITATNSFITRPIAAEFGVENLLATEPEEVDGRFTGKVCGIPCFQAGKVERLKAWLHEHHYTLKGSWFYSDSHNDLPLLNLVDHPVAVQPDPILLDYARAQGWPIIQLH